MGDIPSCPVLPLTLSSVLMKVPLTAFAAALVLFAAIQVKAQNLNIGTNAGQNNQGNGNTAIGSYAGLNSQNSGATAVGSSAGQNNQGFEATALGGLAGQYSQGGNATAIGCVAGQFSQGNAALPSDHLQAIQIKVMRQLL